MNVTRRDWVLGSLGTGLRASIAAARQHAHRTVNSGAGAPFDCLDPEMAAEIEALASQIIPSDDGPGAREAGVIYFIDRALLTFAADRLEEYRAGMAEVQRTRRKLFPESGSIASLPPNQQIELVRAIENTAFFELLRTHTVLGFLGDPSYGGNRGEAGGKHIGFEDRMSYEPPFGYYDAGAAAEGRK